MFLIGPIVSWFATGGLSALGKIGLDFYGKKLDAQNNTQVIEGGIINRTIESDDNQARYNANVVIAEQGNWLTRLPRPAMALCVTILIAKLLVYDKALGEWTHGHTDALDVNLWWVVTTIVVSYFGGRTIEKVADKWAAVRLAITGKR